MKEEEIRPKEILQRYLDLSAEDGRRLNPALFQSCDCQACGSGEGNTLIKKNGYSYVNCLSCNSLYCSPRPAKSQLDELYFNSESSKFWSNVFFPSVKEARREKLFAPKAKKITSMLKDRNIVVRSICDIGAGHGLFLEELRKNIPEANFFAIEPDSTSAQICREKGITTLVTTSENAAEWHNKFDFVICSEVIEHVQNVKEFIESLYALLKPGGYCLITGLGYEGFDILTLQEKSTAVSPPHHLNFLSVDGFKQLFLKTKFSSSDVWTPGQLDVDIVINNGFQNEFIKALKNRGEKTIQEFQEFLAKNNLSSHVWALAKK